VRERGQRSGNARRRALAFDVDGRPLKMTPLQRKFFENGFVHVPSVLDEGTVQEFVRELAAELPNQRAVEDGKTQVPTLCVLGRAPGSATACLPLASDSRVGPVSPDYSLRFADR
jgi:hypothetical protein